MKAKFLKSKSLLAMFDHPRVSYDVDESWNECLFDHIVPLPHYRPPVEKGKDKKEKESHSQTVCNSGSPHHTLLSFIATSCFQILVWLPHTHYRIVFV